MPLVHGLSMVGPCKIYMVLIITDQSSYLYRGWFQLSKSRHHKKLTLLRFHKGFPAKVNSGKFKNVKETRAKLIPISKCWVSLKFLNLPLFTFAGNPIWNLKSVNFL